MLDIHLNGRYQIDFTEGYGVSSKIIDGLSSGGVLLHFDNGIVVSEEVIENAIKRTLI